jgi:hypothetical protein
VSAALARAMKRYPEDRFPGVLDLATALAGVALPESGVPLLSQESARERVEAQPVHPLLKLLEAERTTREPEPARPEPQPVVASATPAAPGEASPEEHRPPLLLVDRNTGERESNDDLEVVDEDKEEERERVLKPVPDDDDDDEVQSAKPVLLWPARENAPPDDHAAAAAASAAAAMASEHLNGGDRTPLLFPDQLRMGRPGPTFGARVWDMARRWTALPRSTRVGSSVAAAVLLMALVWWRVAKGHEEQHGGPIIVDAGPPNGDTSKRIPKTIPRTPPDRPGSTPRSLTPRTPRTTTPDTGKTAPRQPATTTTAEPAHLFIASTPWGVLFVDDKQIGNTPQADLKVPPGSHSIRVSRDGFLSYETVIAIESGEQLKLTDIVLQEKPQ